MVRAGQPLVQIDPRQFQMDLLQAQGSPDPRRGPVGQRPGHPGALPDAAGPGLHRPPGRRHPGRDRQAVARLGHGRPRRRGHGAPERRLRPHRRAGQRPGGPAGWWTPATISARATPAAWLVITTVSPIDVEFTVPQDDVPRIGARANSGCALCRSPPWTGRGPPPSTQGPSRPWTTWSTSAPARSGPRPGSPTPAGPCSRASSSMSAWSWTPSANAVVVPATALRQSSDGAFVWVLGQGRTGQQAQGHWPVRPPRRQVSIVRRPEGRREGDHRGRRPPARGRSRCSCRARPPARMGQGKGRAAAPARRARGGQGRAASGARSPPAAGRIGPRR